MSLSSIYPRQNDLKRRWRTKVGCDERFGGKVEKTHSVFNKQFVARLVTEGPFGLFVGKEKKINSFSTILGLDEGLRHDKLPGH